MQFQDGVFPSTYYDDTADTRIISNDLSNINFGSCFNLQIGFSNNRIWRLLMKFDISSIPASATVKSAYLTLYCYSLTGGPVNVVAYKITRSWIEGNGSCGGSSNIYASWDYYNGAGNSWTNPGGDFDLTTQSDVTTVTTTGYYTIKLNTQMVQDWISNPLTNYGLIIKSIDETSGSISNYDNTTTTNERRPKLTIYYTLP